jgi:putative DNA primase/helicase
MNDRANSDRYHSTPLDRSKYRYECAYEYGEATKAKFVLRHGQVADEGERDKFFLWGPSGFDFSGGAAPPKLDDEVRARLPLYQEKELINKLKRLPEAWVCIFEGESDCHAALKAHRVIICTTSYSSNVWKPEWTKLLRGRKVASFADNDDQGRRYENLIGRGLKGEAEVFKAVHLPGLKDGQDARDWFELYGGNFDKLIELAEKAEVWCPTIFCAAGQIPRMTDEAEASLLMARSEIYVHGSQLVQPVIEECEAAHDRKTKVARLRPMTEVTMTEAMSAAAVWLRQNAKGDWLRTDPPLKVAKTLLEREGRWHLPRVVGVITCPTLRPDGSLLAAPGYDPATRLLVVSPPPMPAIPEAPTKAEAETALKFIDKLLDEFPFVDVTSRSVGLSALLTTVARGSMMCAPAHVVTAPEAGTGKSYLIDIVATITTGRWCPVVAAGRNEEETEKRLGALLIKGQPLVSIDNVNGALGGDLLCQMITAPTVEVRVLGLSKTISVDNRMTLFANGNNIKLIGDLVRRVVRCSMDANLERPETRKFKGNPIDVVLANRGNYIAAALTVVRGFITAGRPGASDLLPFLGFDGWNNNVRGALVWLGQADPADSVKSAREEDPGRVTLVNMVEAIAAQNFDRWMTAGELIKAAEKGNGWNYDRPELRDALIEAVGDRGGISGKSLGRWLDRHAGRVVGDYKIAKKRGAQNQWLWRIVK